MPRVSRFYGISIYLYYRDHPPTHFHAIYGTDEAAVEIATGNVIAGGLPRRAMGLVQDWLSQNRAAVEVDWALAAASQPLDPIPPLT